MNCYELLFVLEQESAQECIQELEGQLLVVLSENKRLRVEITTLVSFQINVF